MNLYIVYRMDREDDHAGAIRTAQRPAHREYMNAFADRVWLGGPLLTRDGQSCGGLMLIEAESEQAVREIVSNDPFEISGLSTCIEIHLFRWQTRRPADMPQN